MPSTLGPNNGICRAPTAHLGALLGAMIYNGALHGYESSDEAVGPGCVYSTLVWPCSAGLRGRGADCLLGCEERIHGI